jgi:hypothetical protein
MEGSGELAGRASLSIRARPLTTNEAAAYTRKSPVTIRQSAAAGALQSTQAGRGRGRRYRAKWLAERLQQPVRRVRRAHSQTDS